MNNYAVSSDGIATALQDSASALMEAGNNLEQSVALVAAANKVVQDPNSVGSALRTISLRLRGTSVSVLEEMGEETDGVVESVSKMQEKIKALTGVNILTDSGAYKDTYTILYEIGQVWNNLENLDRSALLELMAGKNRANTLAAILNNMEDLEGAYNSALGAEGSALKENAAYLDSVQGKIDLVTNSIQTMWMNFIDSSVLKFLLDTANALVKIADKTGLIGSLMAVFGGFKATKKDSLISNLFSGFDDGLEDALTSLFSGDFFKSLKSDLDGVFEDVYEQLSFDDLAESVDDIGEQLSFDDIGVDEWIDSMDEVVDSANNASQSTIDLNDATVAQGDSSQQAAGKNNQNATSIKGVGAASIFAKGAVTIFRMAVSALASALIGMAVQKVIEFFYDLAHAEEQAAERAADAINKYNDTKESLDKQKQTADELAKTYEKLSSGVNTETNANIGLTTEAYEEYLNVCNQIASIYPELITGYDAQGNAILALKGKVDQLNESYQKAAENAALELLKDENKKDVWTTYESNAPIKSWTSNKGKEYHETTISDTKDLLEALQTATEADFEILASGAYEGWEVLRNLLKERGVYTNEAEMISLFSELKLDNSSVDAFKSSINAALSEVNQAIASATGGIKETISASLIFNDVYQGFDESSKGIVKTILNNLDPEMIAESGAQSVDEFYKWFSSNVVEKIANGDYQDVFSKITNISDAFAKAMSDGDGAAFKTAKAQFDSLVKDWISPETGDIVIDEDADAVTQYLQRTAKSIQEQSKNYEVRLQMQIEFDSPTKVSELITQYTGQYTDEIKEAFNGLNLGSDAGMKEVYEQISAKWDDEDGVLRADELSKHYDEYINAINSGDESLQGLKDNGWSDNQIAAIKAVDAVMKLYGTDIDTVKAKLIELGYVKPAVDDISSFNLSSESTQEKVSEFESTVASIKEAWNALNDKSMTKSEFIELAMKFPEVMKGVDLSDDNWMVKAKENLEELNATKIDDFISMLSETKEAMQSRGEDASVVDSFINYANQIKNQPLLDAETNTVPDTISALESAYDGYKTILEETNEVLYDGQKVSEDYYSSLKEYIDDVEELDSCFDKNNKSIVTNVKKLKTLIAQQKNEILTTTKTARAQSQLQYQELVYDLLDATKAYELNTDAGFAEIDSLLQQIDTVQDTILQYKQLELSLLGATNAFEEFKKAQEIDSETDYETSIEEMVGAMGEGFDTGKVGTETFNAAIKGLLPEEVYGDLSDTGDLDAVWKEFTEGNLSEFFTYSKDDGFSIGLKNMENFVAKAQEMGVMTGTTFEEFDVVSGTSLKEFAKAMGLSEDATYAFLEMLSDYSIGGETLTGKLSDVQFDKDIENATNELDELLEKKAEMLRSGDYDPADMEQLNEDIETARQNLESANQAAIDHANKYTTLAALQSGLTGGIQMTKSQLDDLASRLSQITGQQYTISTDGTQLLDAEGNVVDIQTMLSELGAEPTILQVQLAYDKLSSELDALLEKKRLLQTSDGYAKGLGLYNQDSVQAELNKIDGQIQAYETQMDILEVQYGIKPSEENSDTSTIEKLEDLEANGVTIPLNADAEAANQQVSEFQENAERPLETTLTVNTKTGTTSVDTDQPTGVTVDYNTGVGYQAVLNDLASLKAQTAIPITQTVTADDNGTIDAVSVEVTNLDEQNINDKSFNTSDNNTIKPITNKVTTLDNKDIDDKSFDVIMNNYDTVKDQIDTLISKLQSLDDINITATATVNITGGNKADGTAHVNGTAFKNGSWGAPKTETALVGELGPELLVRNGRWQTIGQNGAEFTQVKRGDIIFNHKQTEQLLSNGYVTGRGHMVGGAFAEGNAYNLTYVKRQNWTGTQDYTSPYSDGYSGLSNAADSIADAADEFEEVFDWVAVRLEEVEETLGLLNATLENTAYYNEKNNIIDSIINVNKTKLANLQAGYQEYDNYASKLLAEIPEIYRAAAQNGAIAIEEFAGDADEKTLEAINNYREWAQKAADLKQQEEEVITTIRDLAIQKFDNAYESGEVRATVEDSQTEKLQNAVDYDEERGLVTSDAYYIAMMENSNKKIEYLTDARKAMQEELDAAVKSGQIEKGSNEWYELVNQMYEIDAAIDEATIEIEEFQNAINDIYWDNFDQLINRIDYLKNDTQNLIDLMDHEDMVSTPDEKRKYEGGTVEYWTADDVQWTDEGLASLGLYAQQMEIAEYEAKQYATAIDDLTRAYEAGDYSESEYLEKLDELKDKQYESIESYYDAQDAIKDLNKTRIDSIKEGIEKEIEAYEELINAKKELLDSEKDMHDFQKGVMEQQKNISDIERKLAAIANDTSISAAAKRARLEAELAEARAELEETYYDRSIEDQQNALDEELENFQKEKDEEITKLEEYVENVEQVVTDSLNVVQANATEIGKTLTDKTKEYNLTVSSAVLDPWKNGATAVSDYQTAFDTATSSTTKKLTEIKDSWQAIIDKMVEAGNTNVGAINIENERYALEKTNWGEVAKKYTANAIKENMGLGKYYTVKSGDNLWNIAEQELGDGARWIDIFDINRSIITDPNLIQPGWKLRIPVYAKGTTSVPKDQWSIIDELGEELQLIPDGSGRLAYMKKGTGVVPADLTSNLMEWGKLDPSVMLDQNRPQIGVSPSVVNNTTEIHIDASVGELLHVEHLDGNNPAEISKIVDKAWDKRMKELNSHIRRYTNR